jgi:hypothetical protein
MKKIIAAAVLSAGFASSGFFVGHAISKMKNFDRYVSVKGLATQEVKSNQAIWQIQFTGANDDLKILYTQMAESQEKVKAFLLQQGFSDTDISINPLSITDNQSNAYSSNVKMQRYTANGGVTVSTSKIDVIKQAIQKTGALVQEGVILSNTSIRYQYTELNKIKPLMLDQATESARTAALSFAKQANSQIGAIRHASQGLFTIQDADSNYDNGTSIMKKVRVVVSAQYFLTGNVY